MVWVEVDGAQLAGAAALEWRRAFALASVGSEADYDTIGFGDQHRWKVVAIDPVTPHRRPLVDAERVEIRLGHHAAICRLPGPDMGTTHRWRITGPGMPDEEALITIGHFMQDARS